MAQPLGGCGFLGDQANRLGVEAKEKMNRRTATPCELKRRASVPIDAATPAAVKHLRQYYKTRNHRSSSWPPSPSTTQATPMLFEKVAVENADQRSSSALSLSRSELSNSGHSSGGYINSLRTKALHYLVTASPTLLITQQILAFCFAMNMHMPPTAPHGGRRGSVARWPSSDLFNVVCENLRQPQCGALSISRGVPGGVGPGRTRSAAARIQSPTRASSRCRAQHAAQDSRSSKAKDWHALEGERRMGQQQIVLNPPVCGGQ